MTMLFPGRRHFLSFSLSPQQLYLLKANDWDTRKRCEIYLKLKKKTEQRHSSVFIVNFKHTSHLSLVFLFLNLNL